jgi:phosphosulfolactate synthase
MMNFDLPHLPNRTQKTRESGLTMMMDKGLAVNEVENFISSSTDFTDLVKFGFGTGLIVKNLETKIKLYREAGIKPFFGGTLFEIFYARDLLDDFRRMVEKYQLDTVEISDGSMKVEHEDKLKIIRDFAKDYTVLSEVGSKQKGVEIPPDEWVQMMKTELQAGAWKVIAEARESGTIGIYNADGTANMAIIDDIIQHVDFNNVLWEAPNKNQQVMFIKLLGANVNLGNIATADVVPLETLRLGLRGDTFFQYLPK